MIEKSGSKVKLGMMRHMFIVIDMSECMKLQVSMRKYLQIFNWGISHSTAKAVLGYE